MKTIIVLYHETIHNNICSPSFTMILLAVLHSHIFSSIIQSERRWCLRSCICADYFWWNMNYSSCSIENISLNCMRPQQIKCLLVMGCYGSAFYSLYFTLCLERCCSGVSAPVFCVQPLLINRYRCWRCSGQGAWSWSPFDLCWPEDGEGPNCHQRTILLDLFFKRK